MEWWRGRKHGGGASVNDLPSDRMLFFWIVTGADKLTSGGGTVNNWWRQRKKVVATA